MSNCESTEGSESDKFKDLSEGDIILVFFDKLVDINDMKCIFRELHDDTTNKRTTFKYYPLTEGGLLNAQYIETDEEVEGFYRKDDFELDIKNISFLKVISLENLNIFEKTIAEDILDLL